MSVMKAKEIMEVIPHRQPMLLIDTIEELTPGEHGIGKKCVSYNEPYFAGHFPQEPVMPGVLMIEALAQVGAVVMLSCPEYKGFSDQPVQNPCRRSLQHIKLSLIFLPLKFDLFLHIQIPKHLNTDFPGQEIIAVLVFFIDRLQSLNVCLSVHRTKQTPETLRNFKT